MTLNPDLLPRCHALIPPAPRDLDCFDFKTGGMESFRAARQVLGEFPHLLVAVNWYEETPPALSKADLLGLRFNLDQMAPAPCIVHEEGLA